MNKKYFLLIIFSLIGYVANCHDINIRNNEYKITEENNSAIANSDTLIHLETNANKVNFYDRDLVFKIDFIMPSISLERRVDDSNTFLFSYDPGFVFTHLGDETTRTTIVHQIRIASRYFYNIDKRISRGKRTDKFAGDFLSVSLLWAMESEKTQNTVTLAPTWGLQRNWGGFIHFSVEIGPSISLSQDKYFLAIVGDFKLGFAF